jgi:hypothetical protein
VYNIVKVKSYLQINKKGCVYLWQKWQMYPQLLIDISITTDIVIVINNNGVVNVNQLQMVYECSYAPAFISNVLQIPYGGYLNTTFNNAPVQIVNYASEGFWQIGIGNN